MHHYPWRCGIFTFLSLQPKLKQITIRRSSCDLSTSITQPPSSHVLSLSPRTAHRSISTRVLGLTSLLFGLSFVCRQQEIPSIYRDKMYHKRVRLGATSFLAPFQHQTNPEAITSYCKMMLGRVRLSLSVRSCLLLQRYIYQNFRQSLWSYGGYPYM